MQYQCTLSLTLLFQWDTESGEVVQEYDRHLGAVNTITFVDENRRFVTTSDDKSLRVWEWWVGDRTCIEADGLCTMSCVMCAGISQWT